jgi:putative thioredoxin
LSDIIGTAPPAAGSAIKVKQATAATFMADVVEASSKVPVLVDFWAEWCQPCKQLRPILETAVAEANGRVALVTVDTEANKDLAAQLRIESLPTVMVFKDGQPVDGFVGVIPQSQIKALIDKVTAGVPGGPEEVLAAGRKALENGDLMGAMQAFAGLAQEDPSNASALGLLARTYILLERPDEAEQILATLPPDKQGNQDIASATAALELARQTENAGDIDELLGRLEKNGNDHQARFNLALAYQAGGKTDAAGEALLEIIRREREWNNDQARKQLVKMFDAAGPGSPFASSMRRQLSSILFS